MSQHLERRLRAHDYHRPAQNTVDIMSTVREEAKRFVALMDDELPESGDAARYTALAFTAFEETLMWAMKALAHHEGTPEVFHET